MERKGAEGGEGEECERLEEEFATETQRGYYFSDIVN